jgi:RND family efflux transporter MFP subunit
MLTGESDPFPGKVTVVSPALDPNSTTVEIWVQAKNPKARLRPGSSVQLSMEAQPVPDALVVPASAILNAPDGGTNVMVAGADGRAHQKAVKTGIKEGNEIQILEGLRAEERVISSGAYGLPDNTKISIEPSKEATPTAETPNATQKTDR